MKSFARKRRFGFYDPFADLMRPGKVGIIHSREEFDLGTPNLDRHENVTLIGSNSSTKETLVVKFRWRPSEHDKSVTLLSELHFSTKDEVCYESHELETYQPQHVKVYSNETASVDRTLQFGSRASKLRLYISSPYRRYRLVFMGLVRNKKDGSQAFIKLTCILNPTARVFDFLDQYNEPCAKQYYNSKQQSDNKETRKSFNDTISELMLHDRHDQKCRFIGEYMLITTQSDGKQERSKQNLSLWGFHSRQFIHPGASEKPKIHTKRIYAHMNNGQAYSLCSRSIDEFNEMSFGFASFVNQPLTDPISKPFEGLNLCQQVDYKLDKFEVVVSGQQQCFESKTTSRRSFNIKPDVDRFVWFEIDTNENPGYAWVSLNDDVYETEGELDAIKASRDAFMSACKSKQLSCYSKVGINDCDRLILSLDDDECIDSDLVGSKASSLAHLMRLQRGADQVKFKVPAGFATTKRAHDLLIACNSELQDRIKELARDSSADRCQELVKFVSEQINLPQRISDELRQLLDSNSFKRDNIRFAVRSSSWGEDEEDMSAAGQLTTILNVPNDLTKISKAIMDCFASKFSAENIEYKRQHGLPYDMPMSVVIQEMISCDKAGVLFTCDPLIGDSSVMTITANYGLGESVVSAQADPDSIRVRAMDAQTYNGLSLNDASLHNMELKIEEIKVGQKNVIISGDNNVINADSLDKSKCCMSDDEILALTRCALKVRQYFCGQARDIEWGLWREDSNGAGATSESVLYLFQSRPVTGLEPMSEAELLDECSLPSQAELNFYTRANVGEVMPYAISPLSLTCHDFSWSVLVARTLKYLTGRDDLYVAQCGSVDIRYEKYHSFFNVRSSMIFSIGVENRSLLSRAMELALFGREIGPRLDIVRASRDFAPQPQVFDGWRFEWRNAFVLQAPKLACSKQRQVLKRLKSKLIACKDLEAKSSRQQRLVELFTQIGYVQNFFQPIWDNHGAISMSSSKQNALLTSFLSKFIKDPMQLTAATNKFLAISPDVISAEIPERIEQMARLIEQKGQEELERFTELSEDSAAALSYCKDSENNAELAKKFDEFIERFGHRCYNEFELQTDSWRLAPEKISEMILINCRSKLIQVNEQLKGNENKSDDQDQDIKSENSKRLNTIEEVIASLPEVNNNISLMERLKLKYSLAARSQLLLSVREQTKDCMIAYVDILREAVRQLASELVAQQRLPDIDLVYYLLYDELEQVVFSNQPRLIMLASRRRQMFRRQFGADNSILWKFEEIFSDIIPNHLRSDNNENSISIDPNLPKLNGTPASSGRVRGRICLVHSYRELNKVRPQTILLTHSTDIAFSPVFPLISGIITEVGGLISHGAVVAREYGLPSVIGIPNVTQILEDNEEIILDADDGIILRLGLVDGAN